MAARSPVVHAEEAFHRRRAPGVNLGLQGSPAREAVRSRDLELRRRQLRARLRSSELGEPFLRALLEKLE
jgi:hypothetical protein